MKNVYQIQVAALRKARAAVTAEEWEEIRLLVLHAQPALLVDVEAGAPSDEPGEIAAHRMNLTADDYARRSQRRRDSRPNPLRSPTSPR